MSLARQIPGALRRCLLFRNGSGQVHVGLLAWTATLSINFWSIGFWRFRKTYSPSAVKIMRLVIVMMLSILVFREIGRDRAIENERGREGGRAGGREGGREGGRGKGREGGREGGRTGCS